MEKLDAVDESAHDAMSGECNDGQKDNLPAWASGLRRRAHLCKTRRRFMKYAQKSLLILKL